MWLVVRRLWIVALLVIVSLPSFSNTWNAQNRTKAVNHIARNFIRQFGYPEKKKRRTFSQFGYGLYLLSFPLMPITSFADPQHLGVHSYGRPSYKEHNGALYTCRGGFIDVSHMRAAADWTVYLAFKIVAFERDFDLKPESGALHLRFRNLKELSLNDLTSMAQKIAFERLEWHETASWYYTAPNFVTTERVSAFTPEDTYSNFLGTVIGKRIALRILKDLDEKPYRIIATEEIQKALAALEPLPTKPQAAMAYDQVDRFVQLKKPETERNEDIWWNSEMDFTDYRYVFKRYIHIGPKLEPWLVPNQDTLGCTTDIKAMPLDVPETAETGKPLNAYYTFEIVPDSILFFNKRNGEKLHEPFSRFTSDSLSNVIQFVKKDMESILLPGFDRRDKKDPIPEFKNVRKVVFK